MTQGEYPTYDENHRSNESDQQRRLGLSVENSASNSGHSPSVSNEAPWLGLASFTEETRAYFHGRDGEVDELCDRVQRKLLTVLFGQSGLGKTSILRAGLGPKLRVEDYCPIYVRIDHSSAAPSPSEQIKQAVGRVTAAAGSWSHPGSAQPGESLWEFFHHRGDVLRNAAGRALTPLLIFDQFEEIFTLAQTDAAGRARANAFIADLGDLVENRAALAIENDDTAAFRFDFARTDYRVLIALREDYLANLEGLKDRMPSITQNRVRLARMTGAQAIEAVVRPGSGLVSAEVAAQIVRFISGAHDLATAEVEPSLLSLVCRELNETRRARGHAEISADLLAGSRDAILGEFYERSLTDQPPGVRHFIEDRLLTDSGFRESVAEERVGRAFAEAGAPEALAALVDRRLLRIEERLDVRRVELTHDVLCPLVAASRDTRHAREAKELAERQLAETKAREAATQRALHRARMIAVGSAFLAVVALGGAIFGFVGMRRAKAAEQLARVAEANAVTTQRLAESARAQAENLLNFLLKDVEPMLEQYGRLAQLRQLADRAVGYYKTLPPELRNLETDRHEALAWSTLANVLDLSGGTGVDEALAHEMSLLNHIVQAEPDDAVSQAHRLELSTWISFRTGNRTAEETDSFYAKILSQLDALATKHPDIEIAKAAARAAVRYSFFVGNQPGQQLRGQEIVRQQQKRWQEIIAREPANKFNRYWYAGALVQEGRNYSQLHENAKSIAKTKEAVDYMEQSLEQDPGNLSLQETAERAAQFLAYSAGTENVTQMREAELVARRHATLLIQMDPDNQVYRGEFAESHRMEGYYFQQTGQYGDARDIYRKYRGLMEPLPASVYGSAEQDYLYHQLYIVETFLNEGRAAAALGDTVGARTLLQKAHAGFIKLNPDRSPASADFRKPYVKWMLWEAQLVRYIGDWPELTRRAREQLSLIEAGLQANPTDGELQLRRAKAESLLGTAQLRQGRIEQAVQALGDAVAGYRDTPELLASMDYDRAINAVETKELWAEALIEAGRLSEARPVLEELLQAREHDLANDPGIWERQLNFSRDAILLAATLQASDAQTRRPDLLDRAEHFLTAPGAAAKLTAQDRPLFAKLAALRKASVPEPARSEP